MKTSEAMEKGLADVKVGDLVWREHRPPSWSRAEIKLVEIFHINNRGRLFISAESLWDNWRYGFSPETGKAQAMEWYTLRYASPEEIAAEQARIAAESAREKAAKQKAIRDERIRAAAPDLLKALRGLVYLTDQGREGGLILSRADRKPITNGDQGVIDSAYIAAERAVAKAEGALCNSESPGPSTYCTFALGHEGPCSWEGGSK